MFLGRLVQLARRILVPFHDMQINKFVIFGHPRCGSTYLCSMLESHPKILCHYEVFHPKEIGTCHGFSEVAEEIRMYTPQIRDEKPAEFLRTLFKYNLRADHTLAEAVGFKIFIGHSQEAHEVILKDRDILKILLRRNTIDAYVSMLIAEQTGAFTSKEQARGRSQAKVSLDAGGLLNFDRMIREYFTNIKQVLDDTHQKYLEINYEDIISDQEAVNSVFSFLGIERGECVLTSFTKKQNKKAMEDKIDNVEAVIADFMKFYFEKEADMSKLDAAYLRMTEEKERLSNVCMEKIQEIAKLHSELEQVRREGKQP